MDICEICQEKIKIGEWPFCPHGQVTAKHHGFEPYFDEHLGREFNSIGEKVRHMDKNHIVPADLKTTSKGKDRIFLDMGKGR